MTPAEKFADFVDGISAHLRDHPNLEPPSDVGMDWVQISAPRRPDWFAAWMRSVGADTAQVTSHRTPAGDHAVVCVDTRIGGRPVWLWGQLDGLPAALVAAGADPDDETAVITVDGLESFARTGRIPRGRES